MPLLPYKLHPTYWAIAGQGLLQKYTKLPLYPLAPGQEPDPAVYPEWSEGHFWYDVSHGKYWPPGVEAGMCSGLPVPARVLRDYPMEMVRISSQVLQGTYTPRPHDSYTLLNTYGLIKHLRNNGGRIRFDRNGPL